MPKNQKIQNITDFKPDMHFKLPIILKKHSQFLLTVTFHIFKRPKPGK